MIPGVRLIVLGRQGAGKGTQCVRLSRHYVVPHISTGDMLRAAVKEGTDLGQQAQSIMKAGARPAAENPFGFGQMLMAIYLYVKKPVEVTVIGALDSSLAAWLNRHFLPDGISAIVTSDEIRSLQEYPYFNGRAGDG